MEDRLSNLPPEVTDHILTLLPIKEAAKTSLLSQSWRHLWRSIPHLVLDQDFATIPGTPSSSGEVMNKVTMEIYRALILHKGPITKFVLAVPGLKPSPEIDHVLLHLADKGTLRDLSLRFGEEDGDEPFDFLRRSDEFVQTSLPVAGFEKLARLELKEVVLPSDFFEKFVPKMCPLLEELGIFNCSVVFHPMIVAPRLRALYFNSTFFQSISFAFTPLLSVLSVLENGLYLYDPDDDCQTDTAAVFAALPALRHLTLGLEFLLSLSDGSHIPSRLPTPLHNLTVLEIPRLNLYCSREATVLVCLIMSSPKLRRLTIRVDTGNRRRNRSYVYGLKLQEMLEAESLQQPGGSCLECLEVFNIRNSSTGDMQLEMELVKFVLANAKQLQRVHITPLPDLEATSVAYYLKEVIGYKRASTRAEIIYNWNDGQ